MSADAPIEINYARLPEDLLAEALGIPLVTADRRPLEAIAPGYLGPAVQRRYDGFRTRAGR